jgi:5-formyltetrahydrofolate cyclo-ligase
MTTTELSASKQKIRERVWTLLEARGAVRRGVHGHIPDFDGSTDAADNLATIPAWRNAKVLKAVPDKAQLPVRVRALTEHKIVYMAVPKLADVRPFYLLDPHAIASPYAEVASSRGAADSAPKVSINELRPIDLVICGSVAVNRYGERVGKGAGYSDLEVALLHDAGLLGPRTLIATTVHPLQVLDQRLPTTDHDFGVDLIITPDDVIPCNPARRHTTIMWADVPSDYHASIPVLATVAPPSSER